METVTIASPTLHMNSQIYSLFVAMATKKIDIPECVFLSTKPYCNCREQGFVITFETIDRSLSEQVNYAFYEHRNSDQICVIRWEGRLNVAGAITPNDIPAFKNKWDVTKSFDYMDIKGVLCWIMAEIETLSYKVNKAREEKAA